MLPQLTMKVMVHESHTYAKVTRAGHLRERVGPDPVLEDHHRREPGFLSYHPPGTLGRRRPPGRTEDPSWIWVLADRVWTNLLVRTCCLLLFAILDVFQAQAGGVSSTAVFLTGSELRYLQLTPVHKDLQ